MRSKPLLLALLLLCVFAAGQAAEVRGKVVSSGQNPVTGAVVLHRPSGIKAETDAEGLFVLDLPDAERYPLEVVHPDFYEREFMVGRRKPGQTVVLSLVPLIKQSEEVVVTALRYPESSIDVPAASTIVTGETLAEKNVPNITDALQDAPGVGALGSAGFSLVPSVRGLARRRVLYLIDGARLESDRRTGPNASFVSPDDIERIEVLRSASSVFYGSDAIGGVIHLLTREPRFDGGLHGRFQAGDRHGQRREALRAGPRRVFRDMGLLAVLPARGRRALPCAGRREGPRIPVHAGQSPGQDRPPDGQARDRHRAARGPGHGHRQAERDRRDQADLVSPGGPEPRPGPLEGEERRPGRRDPLPRLRQSEFPRDPDGHLRRIPDQGNLRQDRQHGIRRPAVLFQEGRAGVPARGRARLFRPGRRRRRQYLHLLRRARGRDRGRGRAALRRRPPRRSRRLPVGRLRRDRPAGHPRRRPLRRSPPEGPAPRRGRSGPEVRGTGHRLPGRLLQAGRRAHGLRQRGPRLPHAQHQRALLHGHQRPRLHRRPAGPSAGVELQPRRRAQAAGQALLPRPLRLPHPHRRHDRALQARPHRPIPTGTSSAGSCGASSSRPRRSSSTAGRSSATSPRSGPGAWPRASP